MTIAGDARAGTEALAAEVLGLPRDSPRAQVRTAILTVLRDEEFLPDPREHEAILLVAARAPAAALRLHDEARARDEQRLAAELDAFASTFFERPVADRRVQWARLEGPCKRHDRLLARLQALRPGLSLRTERLRDRSPQVEQLIALALRLFVQPPLERTRNRLSAVRKRRADDQEAADWRRAAKRLRRRFRGVARLAPELVADLARPPRRATGPLPKRKPSWRSALVVLLLLGVVWTLLRELSSSWNTTGPSTPKILSAPEVPARSIERTLRDGFKEVLKTALTQSGRTLSEEALQRIADAQPIGLLVPAFSPRRADFDLALARRQWLDRALRREGLSLKENELGALADRVYPQQPPINGSKQSTGGPRTGAADQSKR